MSEWKTGGANDGGGDYRIRTVIQQDNNGVFTWNTSGDNNANGGYGSLNPWGPVVSNVPVPVGEWFKYEVFTHRSAGSDGRYWTPDNGVNNSTGVYNAPTVKSGIYESRSFVRLQDLSLSYRFGPSILKILKMEGCQFYLAGKNLYTWTNWSGWDPETGISNSPLMRNITVGFRLTL
ncbi:MAG: hypothetical protein Q8N05_03760 [Bacteroidota bacterium]|nr:hypothetical protein [Bacteroidota bacterium]